MRIDPWYVAMTSTPDYLNRMEYAAAIDHVAIAQSADCRALTSDMTT